MYSKFYVRVTRLAEYKLYNILDYIGNYSLKLSLKIEKSFYKKLILIEQFPRIYQKISMKVIYPVCFYKEKEGGYSV